MPKITFNGQEYESPDAMPPEVRQQYDKAMGVFADSDGNGVPDLLESAWSNATPLISQAMQFVVDGKTYSNLDELPPEARRRYEEAMQHFDANADGTPDILAGMPFGQPNGTVGNRQPATPPSLVTEVGERRPLSAVWLAAIAAIVLFAAAVIILLVTR